MDVRTDTSIPRGSLASSPPNACSAEDAPTTVEWMRDTEILARIRRSMRCAMEPDVAAVESVASLFRAQTLLHDLLNETLSPHGLSLAKLNLLGVLRSEASHHLPMSDIGARMCVTRTNITKLVDALESDGLVRRATVASDRRVVLAELTPEGERLIERVMPCYLAAVLRLTARFTETDCRQLTHLLTKLRLSAACGCDKDDQPAE